MKSFQELLDDTREIFEGIPEDGGNGYINIDRDLLPNMLEVAKNAYEIENLVTLLSSDEGVEIEGCSDPIKEFFGMFLVHVQFEMTKGELESLLNYYWKIASKSKDPDFDFIKYEGSCKGDFDIFLELQDKEYLEKVRAKFVSVAEGYISDDPYFNFGIYSAIVRRYWNNKNYIDYSMRILGYSGASTPPGVYHLLDNNGENAFIFKRLWKAYKKYFKPGGEEDELQYYEDFIRNETVVSLFYHFLFSFRKGLHIIPTKNARSSI